MIISHFWLLPGSIPFVSLWHNEIILKKHLHEHELQLSGYNESIFTQIYIFLVENIFYPATMKESNFTQIYVFLLNFFPSFAQIFISCKY